MENNKSIRKSYGDTLSPLQYLLIQVCLINMISIILIFKELIRLFILSNLFVIINLFIHGEFLFRTYQMFIIHLSLLCIYFYFGLCIIENIDNTINYYKLSKYKKIF